MNLNSNDLLNFIVDNDMIDLDDVQQRMNQKKEGFTNTYISNLARNEWSMVYLSS